MPKLLHLGAGSFHRAHQAFYLHKLHQLGDREWTLTIGQLRPDMNEVMQKLALQNGVYTLETVDENEHREYTRIESIQSVIQWTEENTELLEAGADQDCKIVSFTGIKYQGF
jgi:D-arabinitol 4-dehydrogenase